VDGRVTEPIGVAKKWLASSYAMRPASQNSAVELLAISSIASNESICAAPQPRQTVYHARLKATLGQLPRKRASAVMF
jgi:hypothetical protein